MMKKNVKTPGQMITESNNEQDKYSNEDGFRHIITKVKEQYQKNEEEKEHEYLLTPEEEKQLYHLIYKEKDKYLSKYKTRLN